MAFPAFCKPVRENLIHYSALKPFGSSHSLAVNSKLEKVAVVDNSVACAAFLNVMAVAVYKQGEIIMVKSCIRGSIFTAVGLIALLAAAVFKVNKPLLEAGTENNKNRLLHNSILREF